MTKASRCVQPEPLSLFEVPPCSPPPAPVKVTTEHRPPVPVVHTCDGTNLGTCACTKARSRARGRERARERTEAARRAREDRDADKPLPGSRKVQMEPLVHTCDGSLSPKKCDCYRSWMREYQRRRRKNSGHSAEVNRRANLWRLYRITPEEVEALRVAQGGRCAVCGRHEDDVVQYVGGRPRLDGSRAKPRGLVVDHCHRGGQVRALLCAPCNAGLGQFSDDAERLRAAADWLDKIRAQSAG